MQDIIQCDLRERHMEWGGKRRATPLSCWRTGSVSQAGVSTGLLYPQLRSKRVYLCPTDTIAMQSAWTATTLTNRDDSYAMNCIICHDTDTSKFLASSKTMLLMEANFAPTDFSGVVGPFGRLGINNTSISLRHNGRS